MFMTHSRYVGRWIIWAITFRSLHCRNINAVYYMQRITINDEDDNYPQFTEHDLLLPYARKPAAGTVVQFLLAVAQLWICLVRDIPSDFQQRFPVHGPPDLYHLVLNFWTTSPQARTGWTNFKLLAAICTTFSVSPNGVPLNGRRRKRSHFPKIGDLDYASGNIMGCLAMTFNFLSYPERRTWFNVNGTFFSCIAVPRLLLISFWSQPSSNIFKKVTLQGLGVSTWNIIIVILMRIRAL